MAYRLTSTGYVQFALGPLSGYAIGAVTYAILLKRNSNGATNTLHYIQSSGGTARSLLNIQNTNLLGFSRSGSSFGTTTITGTALWYLLVGTTAAGTVTPRFHRHNGTNWVHENGSATTNDRAALLGTDQLYIGFSVNSADADIVCAGIKKTDSADLAVETLSPTTSFSFSPWQAYGFDWLVRFDNIATRTNVTTPGSGDEIARSGVTLVADPSGFFATAPVADFTGTPLTGVAPLTVAFTNLSTG